MKLRYDAHNDRYQITIPVPLAQSLGWKAGEYLLVNTDEKGTLKLKAA